MSNPDIKELTEEKGLSREQAIEHLKRRSEWLEDLDNLKPQTHNWIDRGIIISCENAGHPYHQASKR